MIFVSLCEIIPGGSQSEVSDQVLSDYWIKFAGLMALFRRNIQAVLLNSTGTQMQRCVPQPLPALLPDLYRDMFQSQCGTLVI